MRRREFIKSLGLGAMVIGASGARPLLGAKPLFQETGRKPNFIFILVDDMGWKDAGFMGSTYYETPHMDRLAQGGMTFTQAYANAPNCAPSRACLLSGQYTPRHGVYTVNSSKRGLSKHRKLIPIENKKVLDGDIVTLAEALKTVGYATAHIGKWHLGDGPDSGPKGQGFDVNMGGNRSGSPRRYFSPYKNKDLPDGPEGEYLTDRLTEEALRFIESNPEKPFFIYLSHYAVHTPIRAKKELIKKYKMKNGSSGHYNPRYAAMIESTDHSVGRILDKVKALGLEEDTVIILFSDNGGFGPVTSMAPLRGAKGMLYEGGIRVPMVVRWPGKVKPDSVCTTPVIGLDFYPTLLEWAGASRPKDQLLDGESLVPLLSGHGGWTRETLFWHFPAYLQGYRGSETPWRTTPVGAVRKGDWKLIEFYEDGRLELYHLEKDLSEKNNLVATEPEKTQELLALMHRWRREVDAPVPRTRNPGYEPSQSGR